MPMTHRARLATLPMVRIDTILTLALEDSVGCHQAAAVENADRVRQLMHLDDAPGPVGHAVIVAADRNEPVVTDAPLQLEQRVEGRRWQGLQLGSFGRVSLRDDPLRGAMQADVGDAIEPDPQLRVQVVEVAEGARQEEVLLDVRERPLDLTLGFGLVRSAGAWQEAIVLG